MLKTPEMLLRDLIEVDGVIPGTVSGCTEDEIRELEQTFNVTLPEAYKQFLRVMGKETDSGDFYATYYPFFFSPMERYKDCRNDANKTLSYLNYSLTASDFVFLHANDTAYCWFDTAAGPNPPVNIVDETDEVSPRLAYWPDFLSFLNFTVQNYVEAVSEPI